MINAKFNNKKFKIYENGKINCIENCLSMDIDILKDIVDTIKSTCENPQNGFLAGFIAEKLPIYNVEVLNYSNY